MDRIEQIHRRFSKNTAKIKTKSKEIQKWDKDFRFEQAANKRVGRSSINIVSLFTNKIVLRMLEAIDWAWKEPKDRGDIRSMRNFDWWRFRIYKRSS